MTKGFGGIFWRTKNLEVAKKWYSEVLKIEIDNWNRTVIRYSRFTFNVVQVIPLLHLSTAIHPH
jgi:hypothetical protein